MRYLGLDLSISSTGYSVIEVVKDKIEIIDWGKIVTKKGDFENEDYRMNFIANEISNIIHKWGIELVVAENQFISGRTSAIMPLRKLLGYVCRLVYHEYKLRIEYLAPLSVKKRITGTGGATKEMVAKKIQEEYKDIGEYSDKAGKKKTSDIYDAIAVVIAYVKGE